MHARVWSTIAIAAMFCLLPLHQSGYQHLEAEPKVVGFGPGPDHILLMGNSYVSSNSLHSLLASVMHTASTPANVSSLNGGGMRLSQHATNVATSGHQWNNTVNNANWDWVVLQDQSQIPGLPRTQQEWINSRDGAVELVEVIEDNGGEAVLMMTWGRRDGDSGNAWRFPDFSTMQDELESGYLDYLDNISTNGGTAWIAPVGLAFEHIHDRVVAEGGSPTNSGNLFYDLYSGDGSHPSLAGSYLTACVLYATITGDDPVGIAHSTSLSNSVVLELQQAASATVFNETSHISYIWQTNSGGGQGNQNSSITIPANQSLAWDMAFSFGSSKLGYVTNDKLQDIVVAPSGNIYVLGEYYGDLSLGNNCTAYHNISGFSVNTNLGQLFVAKFSPNGNCIWLQGIESVNIYTAGGNMVIDSNENVYIVHGLMGTGYIEIGNESLHVINNGVFLAKLNSSGSFQWLKYHSNYFCDCGLTLDSSDDIWTTKQSFSPNHPRFYKYNSSTGQEIITDHTFTSQGNILLRSMDADSLGNVYFTGTYNTAFSATVNGVNQNFPTPSGNVGNVLITGKLDANGTLLWLSTPSVSTSSSMSSEIALYGDDEIYIIGNFYADLSLGPSNLSAGGSSNGLLAKLNSSGAWQWAIEIDCACSVSPKSLVIDRSGNLYATGWASTGTISYGNGVNHGNAGSNIDGFVAKFDENQAQWAKSIGGSGNDYSNAVTVDNRGELYVGGYFSGISSFGGNSVTSPSSSVGEDDIFVARMSKDYDGDDIPDVNDVDDDGDFIHDPLDSCHYSPLGFKSTGSLDHDSDGCHDEIEDDDDDNDQLNDLLDSCPKGMTGWLRTNSSDMDDDGCMDALEDYDDDNDGFDDYEDYCSRIPGNSTMELEMGCPDTDGDGRPDILDPFPQDGAEWGDVDGDGVGDNSDAFPSDATQQYDTDGDGFGDQEYGNGGDSCPSTPGNSTIDRRGCTDTDGDGWSDEGDDFPNDPDEHMDSDGDGIPDSNDDFPYDPTQQADFDGDGYGDNRDGNRGDAFPFDSSRYADSDRDDVDDSVDAFPYDPTQWQDADGDGMGDNPMGIGADAFPEDATQWNDIDGDGYGDNQSGNDPDAFPTDATQWSDIDGDGYGDNPAGRQYDRFPENPTQWIDEDGDGLGDNQSGTDADPYLNDFDNDGYNDSIDILPKFASPGDLDADGCMDENDTFPDNARECRDSDGDGIGDAEDPDDDNDGWADTDEQRMGTDSLSSADVPIEGFEMVIPTPGGGAIGLGAWDLMGIFGGVPLFTWLAFCLVTRGGRAGRFEAEMKEAPSREALASIARSYEFALMLRLIGPHQGIRLERLRAELDDSIEDRLAAALSAGSGGKERGAVSLPATPIQPDRSEVGLIGEDGYEWIKRHDGSAWYRTPNSGAEWSWWNN